MKLLTSQKDNIYDMIERIGLAPSQFEFSESKSEFTSGQIKTILLVKNTDFFFAFENGPQTFDKHYSIFCPGSDSFLKSEYPGSWEYQLRNVNIWLKSVLREINAPNKWDRLNKEIAQIKINFDNDQDKFSVNEFEELKNKILAIKQGLNSIDLIENELLIINQKLDHLTEMAKHMNKFDWKSLFVGSIVSIIIQLGITQENAKSLWALIKNVFSNYILP